MLSPHRTHGQTLLWNKRVVCNYHRAVRGDSIEYFLQLTVYNSTSFCNTKHTLTRRYTVTPEQFFLVLWCAFRWPVGDLAAASQQHTNDNSVDKPVLRHVVS